MWPALWDIWSSVLVVMFPWGLVVSWGSLNQLGGGAVLRLFLLAHLLSCSSTQLDHFFSPSAPKPLLEYFATEVLSAVHFELRASHTNCFVLPERVPEAFFAFDSNGFLYLIFLLISFDLKKKRTLPGVCFRYWTVLNYIWQLEASPAYQ